MCFHFALRRMQGKNHTLNKWTIKFSTDSRIDGRELIYNRKKLACECSIVWAKHRVEGWGRVTFTAADIFSSSSLQEGGTALLGWLHQTLSWGLAASVLSTRDISLHLGEAETRSQSGHRAVTEQLCSQLLHNKSQASHWIKVQGLPQTQPTTSHCCHTDLFCHGKALGVGDGRQLLLLQLLNRVLVIPEIEFGAHENDGGVGTVVPHLRVPLQRRNKKWCLLCGAEFPEGPGTFTPQGSQAFPFGQSG